MNEIQLLFRFQDRVNQRGLALPPGPPRVVSVEHIDELLTRIGVELWPADEWIPLLALAQHHGIPTRLLDWSTDATVAAYFAVSGGFLRSSRGETGDVAVWAMRPQTRGTPLLLFYPPYGENPNLGAQRGVFSLWRPTPVDRQAPVDSRSLELLVEGLGPVEAAPLFEFIKFTLPYEHCARALWLLSLEGTDRSRLFPSYEGAAQAVLERSALMASSKDSGW